MEAGELTGESRAMEADPDGPKRRKLPNQAEVSSSSSTVNLEMPHELVTEILLRLPAKSLGRFKCVAKSWLRTISSSQFVRAHLAAASSRDDFSQHGFILTVLQPLRPSRLEQCSVSSVLSSLSGAGSIGEVRDIDYPMKDPDKSFWVVGTLNGLVCIAVEENDLFLWNPCLKISRKLPYIEIKNGFYRMFGFGYDTLNDDYKVVGIFTVFHSSLEYESEAKVYSLKENSWKPINDFKAGMLLDDSGKYANGKLHWIVGRDFASWKIVCFDLSDESYGEIEAPKYEPGAYDWTFEVLDGLLSVICNYERNRADVWVMKSYGKSDSWTRVVAVPYWDSPATAIYVSPICLLRSGNVLLLIGCELGLYNAERKSLTLHPHVNYLGEVSLYVESLVSPTTHAGE